MKKLSSKTKQQNKLSARIRFICCLCSVLFFSFFLLTVFWDYSNITATKYTLFLVLSFGIGAYYIFEKGSLFLECPQKLNLTSSDKFIYIMGAAFLLFSVLSCVFSPYTSFVNSKGQSILLFGSGRYDGLLTLSLYVLLFLIFSFEQIFSRLHIIVISIVTLIMSAIGIPQLAGINVLGFYPQGNYYTNGEDFISTLGNVDFVSTCLVMTLAVAAFSYITLKADKVIKNLCPITYGVGLFFLAKLSVESGFLAIVLLLAITLPFMSLNKDRLIGMVDVLAVTMLSFAVGSVVNFSEDAGIKFSISGRTFLLAGIALAFFILRIALERFYPEKGVKHLWLVLILSEVAGLVALVIYVINYKGTHGTLWELSEILKGNVQDSFGHKRIGLWKYTLMAVKERWFLGYGVGTFRQGFKDFAKEIAPEFSKGTFDFAHNEYLQILYNSGILGLLSYLGFISAILIGGFKKLSEKPLAVVLTFSVIGYLIQAFFTFSIAIISPLFWLLLGMLLGATKEDSAETKQLKQPYQI